MEIAHDEDKKPSNLEHVLAFLAIAAWVAMIFYFS